MNRLKKIAIHEKKRGVKIDKPYKFYSKRKMFWLCHRAGGDFGCLADKRALKHEEIINEIQNELLDTKQYDLLKKISPLFDFIKSSNRMAEEFWDLYKEMQDHQKAMITQNRSL